MAKRKRKRGPSQFFKFGTEMVYGKKEKESTQTLNHKVLSPPSDPFGLQRKLK